VQPHVDHEALLGGHVPKQHTHAANPQGVAGMSVNHFALQFTCAYALPDTETKFRTNGNGFQRAHIATSSAQFIKLRGNRRSVVKSNFRICDQQKAWMGTLLGERGVRHHVIRIVKVAGSLRASSHGKKALGHQLVSILRFYAAFASGAMLLSIIPR
jgi:hypothetical protein